jgi:hypothetical protein
MMGNYMKYAEALGKEPDEPFLGPIAEVFSILSDEQDAQESAE